MGPSLQGSTDIPTYLPVPSQSSTAANIDSVLPGRKRLHVARRQNPVASTPCTRAPAPPAISNSVTLQITVLLPKRYAVCAARFRLRQPTHRGDPSAPCAHATTPAPYHSSARDACRTILGSAMSSLSYGLHRSR